VLFIMPEDETLWLEHSEDQLLLRRCAYWRSFRGAAATDNEVSVRITIPRANVFSVEGVNQLLQPGTP
jgi:hypothetical protein